MSACSASPVSETPIVYSFKPAEFEFDSEDNSRFEFNFAVIESDGRNRLLIQYDKYDKAGGDKLGRFFSISADGGASFISEISAKAVSRSEENAIYNFKFMRGGLAAVYSIGRNIFYTRSSDEGAIWTEPVQINDEQHSAYAHVSFIHRSANDIYCLWQDERRGFPLAYFSASSDGGRTWMPNQPVEYDFREGNQTGPKLVVGAGGRLIAVWEDWRDRQTLVDIRSSYSDDGGRHWSESKIINDDSEHVWQSSFDVVSRGDHVYIVFNDFREPGEEGDNDWNIYFARSQDNGTTWSENIRLNDIKKGVDKWPSLAIDDDGILYCTWASSRENIFGDVVFSYSTDGGQSWSRSIMVSESDGLSRREQVNIIVVSRKKPLCSWYEFNNKSSFYRLAWLEALSFPDPPSGSKPDGRTAQPSPLALEEGETLFADDFSSGTDVRWQTTDGTWMMVKGAYMGVATGLRFFSSYARFAEPESYILKGRFLLDPVSHMIAYLYFRADPAAGTYYVIANRFREGAWLGINEERRSVASRHWLNSRPLTQRSFPFQNNRWYSFKLVVTPKQVDYYVEGRLMLSYKGRLTMPPNKIGIGGFEQAPTYFDDIAVTDIRHEATQ